MQTSQTQAVQLFVTCIVDALYPNVGMATVNILERQGLQVEFPLKQTCCGQPAFNSGQWDEARAMARHTIDVLSETEGPIVIPSGSCADMIGHHYFDILEDDPVYAEKIKALSPRVFELTQFLVDELGLKDVQTPNLGGKTCTYHPSCHGLRNLGLRHQPTTLLDSVAGLERHDLPDAESCCGFGGLFAVKMDDISGAMMNRKLDHIESTGADMLVGGDVSCLLHMAGGLQKRNSSVQVKHIAEVLDGDTSPPMANLPRDTAGSWQKYALPALLLGLAAVVLIRWISRRNKA